MGKRRNRRSGRTNSPALHPPTASSQATVQPALDEIAPASGKIRQWGVRLLDSAVDSALQSIWPIVGGAIVTTVTAILVAIILFFRAPESAWVYAALKYALAFMGGFTTFALLLILLGLIGISRRRRREKRESSKYASTEKGPFDYTAELKPTIKRFQELLGEIGSETTKLGARTGKTASRIMLMSFSPRLRLRAASKGAAALMKRCKRIEAAAQQLKATTDAVIEVSEGVLRHAVPASQGNRQQLIEVQRALIAMDEAADGVIDTQNKMQQTAKAAYGQISMDFNTGLNWLIATTETNILILEDLKSRMASKLVPLLNDKLSS